MKYLSIMSELFSSDSIILLLIGMAVAIAIGLILKSDKKRKAGMVASIIAYALCEVVSNIPAPFLVDIIALFVGTVAIGGFIGFLVVFVVGIAMTNITREETVQFSLFQDESREKSRKIDKAKDALNARFGAATIVRGSSIQSKIDVGKKYKAQIELQQEKEK